MVIRSFIFRLVICASLFSVGLAYPGEPAVSTEKYTKGVFEIIKSDYPIKVDGILDETVWNMTTSFELPFETEPGNNTPAPVVTTCLLTFDDNNLYFAFIANDPNPSEIRAYITDRDNIRDQDRVSLIIDPFNDARRAFNFTVSALGVQLDGVQDQQQGFDDSWDAIWNSAGRITDDGYIVEAAIPFKSLRFPSTSRVQTWGMYAQRWWPRSERIQMLSMQWDRNNSCLLCQTNKITGLTDISPGRNLEVTPTFTSSRFDSREEITDARLQSGKINGDLGFNARWGITTDLTLNATMNPDFSQVEADVAQLDVNNRFALFFPEKRTFFLEGADLFNTPLRSVFTRSIADPAAGLKLTGKMGANAVGAIIARDNVNNLIFPGNQGSSSSTLESGHTTAIARFRRDVGASSNIGALVTMREGPSYFNRLAGVDWFLRPLDKLTIDGQFLRSNTNYPDSTAVENEQKTNSFSGDAMRLRFIYDSRNWHGRINYMSFAPDFRADAGFITRVDIREFGAWGSRRFWGKSGSWFSRITVSGGAWRTNSFAGRLTSDGVWANIYYEGPLQTSFNINPDRIREYFEGEIHTLNRFWTSANIRPSGNLAFGFQLNFGDAVDFSNARKAKNLDFGPTANFRLGRNIDLNLTHRFQRLSTQGQRIFTANLLETRAVYNFNTRTFFRAIFQYRQTDRTPELYRDVVDQQSRQFFTQLLFSYKLNPQSVFFLGYSDNYEGFESESSVRTPLTQMDRTFFLKMAYAWRP